jgi:hypothetical protein
MGKGLPYTNRRTPPAKQNVARQTFSFTNKAMTVADGAPGFGTTVIGDFPDGNILLLGAVLYAQFTSTDVDLIATFDGDVSIGSAPTADNVLSGSEIDIIPSTPLNPATGKVSPMVRGISAGATAGVILDNTDGSLELNLNLLIDDASISGAVDLTVTGALMVAYVVLGDD